MRYFYETPDGKFREVEMSLAEKERRQSPDGKIVLDDGQIGTRNIGAEQANSERNKSSNLWPRCSDAVGVGEAQVKKAYEDSVERGAPTEYNEMGQAVFRDRHDERR